MPQNNVHRQKRLDHNTTIHYLVDRVKEFIQRRNWAKLHSPKNLAISISLEANELLELFQWLTPSQANKKIKSSDYREKIANEVADVFIYLLSFAIQANIDLTSAVMKKLEINEDKYPVDLYRGIAPGA
ncbi:MAG: nucleotide pyrophosphohydrolase [Candidatus Ranarchaeia archaeon]